MVSVPPSSAVELFTIVLTAGDHHGGLAPPGIEFRVPAWTPPIYADRRAGHEVLL